MTDVIAFLKPADARPSDTPAASTFDNQRGNIHKDMMSVVAHDLKTPLASIIGSLEVFTGLQKKLSAEKQAELIKVALQEAYRLDAFVTNILDMAKFEADLVKPRLEQVNVGSLLNSCLMRMSNQMRDSSVRVSDRPHTITAVADANLLSRAICLVLDNAAKYGGTPGLIQIDFGKEDGAFIRIHDNGSGIPEGQADAIFLKHMRLERKDQRSVPGMGLGLTIVRAIMSLMNGQTAVANHHEGGAVFTLSLPAA